jgi:hypothetical protein
VLKKKKENFMEDSEIEDKLVKLIRLFENLEEKDVFIELYSHQLSRRLLTNVSESFDWEKSMISKISVW